MILFNQTLILKSVGRDVIPQIQNLKHQTDQISHWTYHENDMKWQAQLKIHAAPQARKNIKSKIQ